MEMRLVRCKRSVQVLRSTVSRAVARRELGRISDDKGEQRVTRGRILAEQQMVQQISEELAKIEGKVGTTGKGKEGLRRLREGTERLG